MINNILKGKVILITGASSGIGRAMAQFFSKQGAQLVITGRNEVRLTETLNSLTSNNHQSLIADLDSVEGIEGLMDNVFNSVGVLDGLVHCAGIQKTLPLQALKEEQYDAIFSTNVKSAQFLTKFFRRKGRYNPEGSSVLYVSSVAAVCGEPAISTYSASKAALQGLAKGLSMELARQKIRVNCIAPGHVQTEMAVEFSKQLTNEQNKIILDKHPLGIGTPEDVAQSACFMLSDLSRWITGTTLYVDGGYSAR